MPKYRVTTKVISTYSVELEAPNIPSAIIKAPSEWVPDSRTTVTSRHTVEELVYTYVYSGPITDAIDKLAIDKEKARLTTAIAAGAARIEADAKAAADAETHADIAAE